MPEKEKLKADAVFEGGGVKGSALIGALAVAEERGYTDWQNVAGTSAGAIVAAGVAAGYTAAELKNIMDAVNYRDFMDRDLVDHVPLIGHALSIGFEKGIYEGRFFEEWVGDVLKRKGVVTFKDLIHPDYPDPASPYHYRLRVIASDVSLHRMLVLPQDAQKYGIAPDDLRVAKALRMSMSIPFFFEPVKLKDAATGQESCIVDGGLLSNFPIWLFDTPIGAGPPEWPTLGFRLVEDQRPSLAPAYHLINGPVSFLAALFFTAVEAHDARVIEDQNWVRTVPIPTLGINGTDFNLDQGKKDGLYRSGQDAAAKFFSKWDFERYKAAYRQDESRNGRKLAWGQITEP